VPVPPGHPALPRPHPPAMSLFLGPTGFNHRQRRRWPAALLPPLAPRARPAAAAPARAPHYPPGQPRVHPPNSTALHPLLRRSLHSLLRRTRLTGWGRCSEYSASPGRRLISLSHLQRLYFVCPSLLSQTSTVNYSLQVQYSTVPCETILSLVLPSPPPEPPFLP